MEASATRPAEVTRSAREVSDEDSAASLAREAPVIAQLEAVAAGYALIV